MIIFSNTGSTGYYVEGSNREIASGYQRIQTGTDRTGETGIPAEEEGDSRL